MPIALPTRVARPLIRAWLDHSAASWRRRVIADDTPHVHATGSNPDRVLLVGDGVATGRGVLTHDLGLPGHLARSLSAQTGNATDVDIMVDHDMTLRACLDALTRTDLLRYDVIVLSVGHTEALALMSTTTWRAELRTLLTGLESRVAAATRIFLLPIPLFGPRTRLPPVLGQVVDEHAQRLNTVTLELLTASPRTALIWGTDADVFQPETTHLYRSWADSIAARISEVLDPDRTPAGDLAPADEEARQRALDRLADIDVETSPLLDSLVDTARLSFGTSIAAITFIHSDTQAMVTVKGMEPVTVPRRQSFCDVTIQRAAPLVIEDASTDSRYRDYSIVTDEPAVRFYAGYPIQSPDGYRVGALCIMDTEPRTFSPEDVELLRVLAQLAQDHLWRYAGT